MAAGPALRSGSSTRGQNRAAALTLLAPSTPRFSARACPSYAYLLPSTLGAEPYLRASSARYPSTRYLLPPDPRREARFSLRSTRASPPEPRNPSRGCPRHGCPSLPTGRTSRSAENGTSPVGSYDPQSKIAHGGLTYRSGTDPSASREASRTIEPWNPPTAVFAKRTSPVSVPRPSVRQQVGPLPGHVRLVPFTRGNVPLQNSVKRSMKLPCLHMRRGNGDCTEGRVGGRCRSSKKSAMCRGASWGVGRTEQAHSFLLGTRPERGATCA